jgi:hypothetical protein
MSLLDVVSGPRCSTYAEVLARLLAVETEVGEADGLYWFTKLYREMTAAVAERATEGGFRDLDFLEALDCNFAELYFGAVRSFVQNDGQTPSAWWPLFALRASKTIIPLQFALAGINAHINRDLPVALVQTFLDFETEPQACDDRHQDYLAINGILAEVHERAKAYLLTGVLGAVDTALGRVDDVAELFSFDRARDAAWIAGEVRFRLLPFGALANQQLAALDRVVGFAGRGILRPLPVPATPPLLAIAR